jgi:hypothetical protein
MSLNKNWAINLILCLMFLNAGVYLGLLISQEPEPREAITFSVAENPVPAFMPRPCVMNDASLERIESNLAAAQQIAWDWITIEAQCTCNSPWAAGPK